MANKKSLLRSRMWFDDPDDPEMTGIYLERYLNYGLTREELQSDRPIIGIAQTGSDLSPCNRHHIELAKRLRDGIIAAGGVPIEFPVHPIQETGKRPTAMLDRNLAYLGLVETLHGYPIDGVILTIGCDKTTPALLMAATTVNIPAIAFSVGPMLNGYFRGQRSGSGSIVWHARNLHAAGEIDDEGFMELVTSSAPSVGYCNTMGTASTMNSLAEALGMQLPGSAAIPAPYRERGQMAYDTGKRIVDMVHEDLKPSDIMSRESFENAIVVNSALGGSSNAPIHLNAIARHLGLQLSVEDWQEHGYKVPLLTNLQPAGQYLSEDFHHAGGVPAVVGELLAANLLPHPQAITVNGRSIGENCSEKRSLNADVIRTVNDPLKPEAGFISLSGNLFASAIMKTSVISEEFRARYLSNTNSIGVFEGPVTVFDGPEHFHRSIDDPALGIDESSILVMRGAGPIGYPGAAEVVNMRPPSYLLDRGIYSLPCIGDGRQSGTSGSPSILNASPEAAAGGGLALLRNGDIVRIDLEAGKVNVLLSDEELVARADALAMQGGYKIPDPHTPWQAIFRNLVEPLSDGMTLSGATDFQNIAAKHKPRHNH
ncbi:dihydroxy-acid dehydratase family protein [Phaeobacter gallaeciensis]|nr:IlvD/Edd family dehydratase [Phaeobacter gallaeciensis]MDE4193114.1 dihydroxy-acid dehydratase family protein [Phaeobacter gallaeciensis]MDE4201445.1 dihydroxy-acid dehydratase family protein [Phaeobacter gallaeciensis]MDE4205625.1 dihydroxy-acid dehydratase family protein [Phaeobacter gallaeciensis]MDE4209741.1 dihydroxy-acid dehydratase family protein [Phaeobacter gallaeciensis]MDE4218159.1 dihydroxy-acid dehydratase family protein [Phaeobacter gallaeciensis]